MADRQLIERWREVFVNRGLLAMVFANFLSGTGSSAQPSFRSGSRG